MNRLGHRLFHLSKYPGYVVLIKVNPGISAQEALGKIKTVFKNYNPAQPFDYQFADEEYAKKFGNEQRIGKLASFFAILAIFISCLGFVWAWLLLWQNNVQKKLVYAKYWEHLCLMYGGCYQKILLFWF